MTETRNDRHKVKPELYRGLGKGFILSLSLTPSLFHPLSHTLSLSHSFTFSLYLTLTFSFLPFLMSTPAGANVMINIDVCTSCIIDVCARRPEENFVFGFERCRGRVIDRVPLRIVLCARFIVRVFFSKESLRKSDG